MGSKKAIISVLLIVLGAIAILFSINAYNYQKEENKDIIKIKLKLKIVKIYIENNNYEKAMDKIIDTYAPYIEESE